MYTTIDYLTNARHVVYNQYLNLSGYYSVLLRLQYVYHNLLNNVD